MLLKNGTVYTVNKKNQIHKLDNKIDIRIDNGVVSDIAKDLAKKTGEEVFDLSGLTVLPGFIDLHAHLRDFEQENLEDFNSGAKAAAAGGFTTVVAMANTIPPRDNIDILQETINRSRENSCIEILPVAAITKGLAGNELTNMVELAENGAVAFSDDGMPIMNMAVFKRALSYASLANSFIISHSEDKHLSADGSMNESKQSTRMGLAGIPTAAETVAVAREIEVLRHTGGRLHITHLSTASAANLIKRAKEDGLAVTADVTPHHLTLRDEDIPGYDANYKMNPPLRAEEDRKALIDAVIDGTIDAIATDHAPHTSAFKRRPFEHCSFGILGFETAFPLSYEKLVLSKAISFEQLIELFTINPAKILGRRPQAIAIGQEANITVVDLNEKWHYDIDKSLSKSRNSPFSGRQLIGRNTLTLWKGQKVFQKQ